jgi:hypothetical protein
MTTMASYTPNQAVLIKCEIQPGPFPTEWLVTFQAADGPVSGFVRRENVRRVAGGEGYITATVKEASSDTVTVVVEGSFFTTNGLAYLNRAWADAHVSVGHA